MTPDNEVVTKAIDAARSLLKSSPELMPTFMLGSPSGIAVLGTHFDSDQVKDSIADTVKQMAADINADFILFVAESYTIRDQEAARDFINNQAKYGSVSNHPKAVEVVAFTLETKTRNWLAIADILPDRSLGEVSWEDSGVSTGRFVNLLGEKPTLQ